MPVVFKPLSKTFGVEVCDLDFASPLDPEVKEQLRAAFRQFNLLLVRDVGINTAEQAAFADIFGDPAPLPVVSTAANVEEPETQYVSNTRSGGILPNGELAYHQDHLFDPEPVRAIMLYGVEVPASGSATKFRSCSDIYEHMSEPLRSNAENVRCLHLFDFESEAVKPPTDNVEVWASGLKDRDCPFSLETASPNAPRTWQPLIWRNPETGLATVWCNHGSTVAFEGATYEQGKALLNQIADVAEGVDDYVHDWRTGDLLLWNNLTLQHARLPFKSTESRTLRRSTIM